MKAREEILSKGPLNDIKKRKDKASSVLFFTALVIYIF
jgi:hypothetical protein